MKTLIVDDDFASRLLLQEILKVYGSVHIAANGKEAVEAAYDAIYSAEPYDLICLDIAMPEMDGQEALKGIRALEAEAGIAAPNNARILMVSAFADSDNVTAAIRGQCDYFLAKPIRKNNILDALRKLALIA